MNIQKKGSITWIIVSFILSMALIVSSIIVTNGIIKVRGANHTLTVKGSAKKQITSDFVVWTGSFGAQSSDLSEAYKTLKESSEKVKKYLTDKGVREENIIFSSINTNTMNRILPNGTYTNEIESYRLYQNVEIRSNDIEKITDISRKATDLINEGVEFQSYSPQYFYTKLADLKIDMIELATKDAKARAEKMLGTTGNKAGKLRSASVGIFQITPLYSEEISDYGINDTSSIEKEITSVVTCEFEVE
ncbi:MAG: SIMPL domain-containing protein [Bacillota bacterium]